MNRPALKDVGEEKADEPNGDDADIGPDGGFDQRALENPTSYG